MNTTEATVTIIVPDYSEAVKAASEARAVKAKAFTSTNEVLVIESNNVIDQMVEYLRKLISPLLKDGLYGFLCVNSTRLPIMFSGRRISLYVYLGEGYSLKYDHIADLYTDGSIEQTFNLEPKRLCAAAENWEKTKKIYNDRIEYLLRSYSIEYTTPAEEAEKNLEALKRFHV